MTKPIKFADSPGPAPSAAPTFGQHSDEILEAYGYSTGRSRHCATAASCAERY